VLCECAPSFLHPPNPNPRQQRRVDDIMDDREAAARCDYDARRERRLEQEERERKSREERYTDDLALQETRRLVPRSDDEDAETDGEGSDGEGDGYSDAGSDASSVFVFKRPGGAPRNWAFSVVDVIPPRRRVFTMIGLTAAALLAYSLFASSAPLEPRQQGIAATSPPWYPTRWCIPSILLPPRERP